MSSYWEKDGDSGEDTDRPLGEPDPSSGSEEHHHGVRDAFSTAAHASMDAEQDLTARIETEEELRHGLVMKVIRATGGFMIIGVGIALLPLPGPGWVVIIVGLSLLPFAWAERTIRRIRRTIPGIPEDGKIPLTSWILMGVLLAAAMLIALLFGGAITDWLSSVWRDVV